MNTARKYSPEDHPQILMEKCLAKVINSDESALNEKHVRSIIQGTFRIQGGSTFWDCVIQFGLKENPIMCWKFYHLLHKVLREGHGQVLEDSLRFKEFLEDHANFRGFLKTGYGELVKLYSTLLEVKLEFHEKNNWIPGNLELELDDEADALFQSVGEDEDDLPQLCDDMFDYLEAILDLQAEIFKTIDILKCNSMTNAGQCRLSPLIPCIQDSVHLYDCLTKIIFRLHAKLSPDLLSECRDRYQKVFLDLKKYLRKTMSLVYFKDLLEIRDIPKNPPNFLNQYEISNYQSIGLKVLQPHSDDIDLGDDAQSDTTSEHLSEIQDSNCSATPDHDFDAKALFVEKEKRVKELESELERLKLESKTFKNTARTQFQHFQFDIDELRAELNEKAKLLEEREKQIKESDAHVSTIRKEFLERLENAETTVKLLDDKFLEMKDMHTNLHSGHIQLLGKSADVKQEFADLRKSASMSPTFAGQINGSRNEEMGLKLQMQTESEKSTGESRKENGSAIPSATATDGNANIPKSKCMGHWRWLKFPWTTSKKYTKPSEF